MQRKYKSQINRLLVCGWGPCVTGGAGKGVEGTRWRWKACGSAKFTDHDYNVLAAKGAGVVHVVAPAPLRNTDVVPSNMACL
jgi:hypothetical protein